MGKEEQLFHEFDRVNKSEWEEVVKRDLKGADYKKKLRWETLEGFSFEPYFTSDDIDNVRPPINDQCGWISCEPIYEESPEKIESRIKGSSGLESFLLKLTVTDDPGASARDLSGVKILNQEDFDRLANAAISSEKKLFFDAGMASPAIIAMAKNSPLQSEDFLVIYDPLSHIAEYGRYPAGKDQIMKIIRESMETNSHCLCADGSLYKHAGATIVEEVAVMLSLASEYIAMVPGNKKEMAARSLFFRTSAGPLYFPEMAKIRAIRLLWKLLLEEYHVDSEINLPVFVETSKTNKPLTDSYNNMVRVVSEGMSAVIGGADALLVHPYNEHYEEPSAFSRRIARNVQHILREEAHLGKVADPAAGSYYIEKMTDVVAEQSWNLFKEIELDGGFLKSAELGTIQEMVNSSSGNKKQAYATRRRILVGSNNYPNSGETLPDTAGRNLTATTLPSDEKLIQRSNDIPVIPTITEKFKHGAAIGQWTKLFYDPGRVLYKTLHQFNAGEELDFIRTKAQELQKNGEPIKVQLVQAGNETWRRARASFSANFLGCAGFNINDSGGFDTIEEALQNLETKDADIFVLCSSDDEAVSIAGPFAKALPKDKVKVLAGNPGKNEETFKSEGFNFFIHLKANLPATLEAILDTLNREEMNK